MADISKITIGSTTYDVKDAGASRSGHTHTTSIASSSATNQITLSASTKYAITAGGTSYVFTTPADTNTWRPIGTGATDAAAGNHTHSTSIAASSGTNQVTLAANTKYAITAGGTSYVFTTPPDTNTWRGIQNNLTSDSTTDSLSAAQGKVLKGLVDGKAASGHTHATSIAASSGTNQITLAANTKYAITAGGTSYIFTTPPDTNTWRGIQDNLTSSTNTTESLSAKQGYLLANGSARDSTKVPTTRKVNGKALSADISLTAADVGAVTTDTKNTVGNEKSRLSTFYLVGVSSQSTTTGSYAQSYTYDGRAFISGGTLYIEDLNVDGSGYFEGSLDVGGTIKQSGTAVVLTNDSRMTNARPASDVYSWAKASSKPSYTYSEVGAASSSHTHATSIATSSGTNQITLAANTKYALSAGGTSYVFTTPPDTNTWRGIQDNLTSSTNTTESLSAKQGYLLANGSARDSTKVPTTRKVNNKALSADISLTASDVGAATSGHTHTTLIATTSDTNQITLAASTKYKLTAGGTSYVFTTPPSGGGGSLNLQLVRSYTGHASSNTYASISFDVTVSPSYLYYIVPMLHLYSDSSYDIGYYEVNADITLSSGGSPYYSWNTIIGARNKVLAASYEDHATDPQFNYTDGWLYMSDPFQDDNSHDTRLKGSVTLSRKTPTSLELSRLWWTLNIYRICTFDAAAYPMD